MNKYTITIADAHSHTVSIASVAAQSKIDALQNVLAHFDETNRAKALTASDTWTITITQP